MAQRNEQLDTAQAGTAQTGGAPRRNLFRSGLLIISSAALGGIAVAIWNRRTLARMRERMEWQENRPRERAGDESSVFP